MLKCLLVFAIVATAAGAQEFEVASIRRCADDSAAGAAIDITPGRFTANCVSVDFLIETAYTSYAGTPKNPISRVTLQGAPAWIKSETYRITAQAEDPNASRATLGGAMLWNLLETRFRLKTDPVVEEIPIYAVVLGKDDSKLRAHEEHSCSPCAGFKSTWNGPRIILTPEGVSLDWLSFLGPMAVDRPVVNRTGITGSYTFRLEFERERPLGAAPPVGPSGPSIFDALDNELGLKLVEAKGQAARLIIDRIERPSDN